jgi:type II secretory pathway component GspD/PulD (secretin)
MTRRFPSLILLVCSLAVASDGFAQDDGKPAANHPEPAKVQRTVYLFRSPFATEAAQAIGKQFVGQIGMEVFNAGTGPAVLITASEATTVEVLKLLGQFDRAPRSLEIELTIAEAGPGKPEPGKEVDVSDFTGPSREVTAKIDAVARAGSVQRIRLTTLENQTATVQYGGSRPLPQTTGSAGGRGGPVQRSIAYVDVGTKATITAVTKPDDTVTVHIELSDSRLKTPEPGERGDDLPAGIDTAKLTTTVNVKSGHAAVAQAVRTDGKAGPSLALVVVAAKVIDPPASPGK